jgi:phenylacetic acid degradation operon negative regulatory protein
LVLDLLSTLRGGAMPVRALVAAGELFGVPENGIRVEIARLMARALVTRDQRGRYRLADASQAVQAVVAAWTRIDERVTDWDGSWIAVHAGVVSRGRRAEQRQRDRAFGFLGFCELTPALWIRPRNLRGGVVEVRRQLHALGLDARAPVFAIAELDDATEATARGLWDARTLVAGYRRMRRALEDSERQLPKLPVEQAMVETFLLGGQGIRTLTFDPLLPEPIVPGAERIALTRVMQRYNRVGRKCWSAFMRAHGAPYQQSPVNLRVVSAAEELPAAIGSA